MLHFFLNKLSEVSIPAFVSFLEILDIFKNDRVISVGKVTLKKNLKKQSDRQTDKQRLQLYTYRYIQMYIVDCGRMQLLDHLSRHNHIKLV